MKKTKLKPKFLCLPVIGLFAFGPAAHADDTPLFEEQFDTQEDFDRWTVINVDETSTTTWTYYKKSGNGIARLLKDMSDPKKPQDDWLISPAITLEEGTVYRLSCYVGSGVYNTEENLRITLGGEATAEAQTTELLDINGLIREESRTFTADFSVSATGTHHIGFYAYSEADQGRIELDSITITVVAAGDAPAPVSDLSAKAGAQGALKAELSFVAPGVSYDGSPLESLDAIDIYREGTLIKTIEGPQPGATLTYTDESAAQGNNTYTVAARNGSGESEAAEVTVYVGQDVPVAVSALTARRTAAGAITLTWEAPSESANGGYFNPEDVKYAVMLGEDELATVSVPTYTYTPEDGSTQAVYSFTVVPEVSFGSGAEAVSNRVIAGQAVKTAYEESFAGGSTGSYPWCQDDTQADFDWETVAAEETETGEDYDGDGGMMAAYAYYASNGEMSRLMSPLFDLSQMENPVLSFYMYRWKEDDPDMYGHTTDTLTVQVSVDGGEWADLNEARFSVFGDKAGWVLCEVPLTRYEGSTVEFGLLATLGNGTTSHQDIYVDKVSVGEAGFTGDLAVRSFAASRRRVSIGEDTEFTVEVLNRGAETASDYRVVLRRDGVEYAAEDGVAVLPTESRTYSFTVTAAISDTRSDSFAWDVEVESATDEVADNNVTETINWSVRKNDVPAPANLSAEWDGSAAVLTWDKCQSEEPVTNSEVITVTDDFESYEPFIIDNIGDWTVLDLDGGATLATSVIPVEYPHKGEPMAWQVFNTTEAGVVTEDHYDNVFLSHSGEQYLMCASNDDYDQSNDDWLISPRLDGRSQTISFYARTPNSASGADWLKVYYSSTDKHPDSFIQLGDEDHIAVWDFWNSDAYTFTLPEGAKYFAIRCVRSYLFCMIDDVTYNADNGTRPGRELIGYNVYRDGEKMNSSVLTDNAYTDEAPVTGASYTVTAVYDKGESDFSDEVTLKAATGVGATAADAGAATATGIFGLGGTQRPQLTSGVNIVRMSDGTVRKVVVKSNGSK